MTDNSRIKFGAKFKPINLKRYFNWPYGSVRGKWWQNLTLQVKRFPKGNQKPWGIPFSMGQKRLKSVILITKETSSVRIKLESAADFLCVLHQWYQLPQEICSKYPVEGKHVAEYELIYADGTTHIQPVRARFEVVMLESPGPPWLALPFDMEEAIDTIDYPRNMEWGHAQVGLKGGAWLDSRWSPLVYAMANSFPDKKIHSLTIRGLCRSPLIVAGLTLYCGASHPLRHLPRRLYRIQASCGNPDIEKVKVDLGGITRIEKTKGHRNRKWLMSPYSGISRVEEPATDGETLLEVFGVPDATLSVKLRDKRNPLKFSLGEAFHRGMVSDASGEAEIEVIGKRRQWMRVVIRDSSTGKPTSARLHLSGSLGEYIAPYGHHSVINPGFFMDYGADVIAGGRNFAYVDGEFTTELPVGDIYVEINKGFEYMPVRRKVRIEPGQDILELSIERANDWRSKGWVTADTHVHFISPQTAWLQARAEGINVVNLLASQWGRMFTNVGDFQGRAGIVEGDTIVYVGTENRNHMLGHMSMLGTKGLPVYPMCSGGPREAWLGDPDFVTMSDWALENKRKGGVVIRPHFPGCGHTEDPVPIIKGLVDALEIFNLWSGDFPLQEWYRYLNCGYPVAVVGGTDKMGAYCSLGWVRTYALLDKNRPFDYKNWADAVRAGRTFTTTGPLIDIKVEGRHIGERINLPNSGGTVEVEASTECLWPLGKIEIVHNGHVVAVKKSRHGENLLNIHAKVKAIRSGWIAARCTGCWSIPPDNSLFRARPGCGIVQGPNAKRHPGGYVAAHTSPIYIKCGETRAFDGLAAQHMLKLVEGGIEYLQTLATAFDETRHERMIKQFKDVHSELNERILIETQHL